MGTKPKGSSVRPPLPPVHVLGLDVGGLLAARATEYADTSFFGFRPMETPGVPGAREAVARLSALFEHRHSVVSKAGPKVAALIREWLGLHGLLGPSMIPAANLFFVRQREDKGPICKKLGVTHFVDVRLDVLTALLTVRPERCLPADSLLPGHMPVQLARCPGVGKRDMSVPISARITWALR